MGVVQNSIDIQKIIEAGGDPTIAAKVATLESVTEVKDITTEYFSLLSENNLSLYTAVSKVYIVGRLIVINAVLEQPNGYATGTEEHFAFPSKYSPAIDLVYNAHIAESGYAGNSAGIGCYLYLNNSGGGIIKNISSTSNNWKYVKINLAYIHK